MSKEKLTLLEKFMVIAIVLLGVVMVFTVAYLIFLPITYLACYALSIPFEFKFVLIPSLLYFFIKSLLKK